MCEEMPTLYVNGCSYNHKGNLQAGAGVVLLNNDPCIPQEFNLGPQSSQYAKISVILITLQLAASQNIKELLICTDSNYACLSFTCHLTGWKRNGFKTANNKPVKHQELFQASVTEHDMIVYWKKVRGHSHQLDKTKTSMSKQMSSPNRCITWRVLDISCPPTQPFIGSRNPPPARHWRAHPCLLPHCPITSVRC